MQDANYETLREQVPAQAFSPASQVQSFDGHEVFELRTAIRPEALSSSVEEAIGQINRSVPLEFQSLAEQVGDSLVQERLLARLSAFFGGLALLLAAIGLYGVLSYSVTQRQAEFGIRMALGARAGSIFGLVLQELGAILVVGVVAGIALAALLAAVLQTLLFGLTARDFPTFSIAALVLAVVACAAGYLPARRATRVDPIVALRHE